MSDTQEAPVQVEVSVIGLEEERWVAVATSSDGSLYFGRWQVSDATGEVATLDGVASGITSPGVRCAEPVSRLASGATPPLLLLPTETPVSSAEEAQVLLWVSVYNCYNHYPELTSFTAYQHRPQLWVVEGKSSDVHYGLWQVDGADGVDGRITPLDPEAMEAATTCEVPPAPHFGPLLSTAQAELLVWATVYDCFARPKSTSFTAFAADPAHWIVEGREAEEEEEGTAEPVFYGLWIVDATTSEITPSDELAEQTVGMSCYQLP